MKQPINHPIAKKPTWYYTVDERKANNLILYTTTLYEILRCVNLLLDFGYNATSVQYITLYHDVLYCIASRSNMFFDDMLRKLTLRQAGFMNVTPRYVTLRCIAFCCVPLRYIKFSVTLIRCVGKNHGTPCYAPSRNVTPNVVLPHATIHRIVPHYAAFDTTLSCVMLEHTARDYLTYRFEVRDRTLP